MWSVMGTCGRTNEGSFELNGVENGDRRICRIRDNGMWDVQRGVHGG